jgi:hypothetical protein
MDNQRGPYSENICREGKTMTKATIFLFLCLCLGLLLQGAPAYAFESPVVANTPEYRLLEKLGAQHQPTAANLGCPSFAWGNFIADGKIASLEYLPEGAGVKGWKRLATVTVYALSGEEKTDLRLMDSLINGIDAQLAAAEAHVLKTEYFATRSGEPGMFVEYEVGEGADHEHNAGVFLRISPRDAAFIQIQSRGQPLAVADRANVRALIQPRG